MKAHFAETGIEFFFHRYLIDCKRMNPDKRRKFQNQEEMTFSTTDFGNSKTGLHKCRMVKIGQQNLEEWPLYLLKRVSYIALKKQKKGKSYQVADPNIKKISQLRTEYLCYQIMSKSHRVVRMIEIINENPKKQEDQQFFYKFLGRKKQQGVQNACFILELCNDGNLDDRINNFRNPLTQDNITLYCCQIMEGLIELKKKGILHRDLRPCNIFLHNDEVKFGDFDSAFIYKQSQPSDVKSGIDINTTPQQIVQLSALSDEELQQIGNIKLFELQSKCDIYFFGMIVFKMIFKREYEKKFEGTDIEYLIREKIKEGFGSPELLEVMKRCLITNVQKRIDLVELYDKIKNIQKLKYFNSEDKQRTYLSEDPLNLFSYRTLQPTEPEITTQIQNSISHTFTLSFVSIEYDFETDFQKATFNRATKLYAEEVTRVHSRFYKNQQNASLWGSNTSARAQLNRFLQLMEDFVMQMSTRAYYYDYLYRVILKIDTKSIPKKEQKSIVTTNKNLMEKELIIILKFLFEILSRTPFKIDRHYSERNLPYQTRKLFKDKIKITNKYNFFMGRAKTFEYEQFDTYKVISQFFNINYEEIDSQKFETIYENILFMVANIDQRLKKMLSQSIVDLFRPFDSSPKSRNSHLKEILFIMITLEKQKLSGIKKSNIVQMKQLLQSLFNAGSALDLEEAQLFFYNYKQIHKKQVQESKRKQNLQLSFNLLSVSKKHLDCLTFLLKPFALSEPLPELKEEQQFAEEQNLEQKKSNTKENKEATYTLQYDYQVNEPYEVNQANQAHQINSHHSNNQKSSPKREPSPVKQQIQVKVFQEQDNQISDFDQNLQASNFQIMT